MEDDKDLVWDRLKYGVQESKFVELQRLAEEQFTSDAFLKWKVELRGKYQ